MSCVAYGCTNRASYKDPHLTFHRFPRDAERRAVWIKAVHRKNWVPSSCSFLCSNHFTDDCFDRTSWLRVRLNPNAVPSVFPAFPAHLQKKVQNLKQQYDAEFRRKQAEFQESSMWQDIEAYSRLKKEKKRSGAVRKFPPNLCRICARSSGDLVAIFGDYAKAEEVLTKIHTHLPITVTAEDRLPVNICADCLKNLDICHSLVKACLNADATLKRMLGLPVEKNAATVPANDGSKRFMHVRSVTTVATQTQPLYVLAPVVPQNGGGGGQNTVPVGQPPCMLVSEDVLVQMIVTENEAAKVNELPVKVTPVDKIPALLEAGAEQNLDTEAEMNMGTETEAELNSVMDNYCDACDIQFVGKNEYLNHKENNQCTYECRHCDRNFWDKSSKEEHERLHTKERPYLCATCDKGFHDMSLLRRHMDVHRNKMYKCEECGKVYYNRSGLYWHKWTHRNATYLCPICGELVPRGSSVYRHRLKHSSTCSRCCQKFDNWELLKEHEKTTLCGLKASKKSRPSSRNVPLSCINMWKCDFCPCIFKTLAALSSHLKLEHKYRCFDCVQFFKNKDELSAHKQTHCEEANSEEGEANHPVEPSGHSHSNSHGDFGSMPWEYATCDNCGMVFTNKQRYRRHLSECASLQCFECQICGKILNTKYRLLVHKQVHASQKPYRCVICGKRFKFLNYLKKHCIISHPLSQNFLRGFTKKFEIVWM